jgi:hypothetical protein
VAARLVAAVLASMVFAGSAGAGVSSPGAAKSPGASPSPNVSCREPALPRADALAADLQVIGNQVLDGFGRPFIFRGLSIFGGLQDGDRTLDWQRALGSSSAQIKAAKEYWSANAVRLQVAEANLFSDLSVGSSVNVGYLRAICRQVRLARAEGLQVVLNDQTEFPDWSERDPTQRTLLFWRIVAPMFANQPGVSFDLFNEPRLLAPTTAGPSAARALDRSYGHWFAGSGPSGGSDPTVDPAWVWKVWSSGGKVGATNFVGMQALVDEIRALGINNPIWIEGPFFDNNLDEYATHPVIGTNLILEIHHPPFEDTVHESLLTWQTTFGYLTPSYPVVDGEWSQYASPRSECRPNAYTIVPAYLRYLRAHGVGLLAWSAQAGSMLADPLRLLPTNRTHSFDPTDPNELSHPNQLLPDYGCTMEHVGQGAGQLLMTYFQQSAGPARRTRS